jgi:DNA-binding MarR family transcriptional regulator
VALGLIERTVPANDRRRVCLSLTAKGEEVYRSGVPLVLQASRRALKGVDPKALREFARLLQIVLRNQIDDEAFATDLISYARPEWRASQQPQD